MTPTFSKNSMQPAVKLLRVHVCTVCDERGFALVLAMCMLSMCMLIGIAAMNTSVDEVGISKNEVMVRRTLTYAMSGVPLAALPIESKHGEGGWPHNNWVLEDSNNYITILHSGFLDELADRDINTSTGWNNWDKWDYAKSTVKKANFMPIDDIKGTGPLGALTDCTDSANVEQCADIRIGKVNGAGALASDSLFTMLVDVDRLDPKLAKGGNTGFGEDPEVLITYVMDCRATLPGRDMYGETSPINEVVVGYFYKPGAAF